MDLLSDMKGSIVALVTPMKQSDNSVDVEALERLVEWQIEEGTNGFVACGSTGEAQTLDLDEYKLVLKTVVDKTAGRVPVLAGSGTNNTKTAVEKTQMAKDCGCTGAMIVCPWYNKPTQEGLYVHFKTIHDSVQKFPILLYNIPSRTGVDMLPETVARLSKLPYIFGIKDATGGISNISHLKRVCEPDFKIYTGEDPWTRDAIALGAVGVTSVVGNVVPGMMAALAHSCLTKDVKRAEALYDDLYRLMDKLFIEVNPTAVKFILSDIGKIEYGIRLPLLPLSEKHHTLVREVYKETIQKK